MHVSPSKINHTQPKLQHEEVSMKKRKKKKRESNYGLPEVGLKMQGKQQNVHPLVKKVNKYLENIRKNERDQNEKQNSPVYGESQQNSVRLNHIKQLSELRKYLGILQQPRHQETNTKDKDDIFNRSQTYFITQVEDERRKSIGEGYSRESSMLINAKIRRKFNHKKMLALFRF